MDQLIENKDYNENPKETFTRLFGQLRIRYNIQNDKDAEAIEKLMEKLSPDLYLQAILPNFTPIFQSLLESLGGTNNKQIIHDFQLEFQKLLGKIKTLEDENEILRKIIKDLQDANELLKTSNTSLEHKFNELQIENKNQADLLRAYDVFYLFNQYFTKPLVEKAYKITMKDFWDELGDKMAELKDSEITIEDFNNFITPLSSLAIPIVTIKDISSRRHDLAHTDLKSASDQMKFIKQMEIYKFSNSQLQSVMTIAINQLKTASLKRIPTKSSIKT